MLRNSYLVNGTDIKQYIQPYGLILAPLRPIYGTEGYVARSGKAVLDVIAEKRDHTIRLIALSKQDLPTVCALFQDRVVTITYWNAELGQNVTSSFERNLEELELALADDYKEIYNGLEITLTEL